MSQVEQIKAELEAAQSALSGTVIESEYGYHKAGFAQAIADGAWTQAMEILACVIDDNPNPGKTFWSHMIKAAELLGDENAALYRSLHDAA